MNESDKRSRPDQVFRALQVLSEFRARLHPQAEFTPRPVGDPLTGWSYIQFELPLDASPLNKAVVLDSQSRYTLVPQKIDDPSWLQLCDEDEHLCWLWQKPVDQK